VLCGTCGIALAGGLSRAADLSDNQIRNQLRDLGSLREASISRAQLAVRVARLSAETEGAETVLFPANLTHPDGADVMQALITREQALFESRNESLNRGIASLDQTEELLSIARGDETQNNVERNAELKPLDVLEVSAVSPDEIEGSTAE